ncbi:MAG: RNA polymerase sigma factor [Cyclobacteriaceae bacterium]
MKNDFSIDSHKEPTASWPSLNAHGQPKNDLESLTDGEIWELFREGQELAFIHIYQKHFQGLFHYGSQFTENDALIEDAIQDMFIELRENRKRNVIKSSIRNYLFTCLRRRILQYKQKFDNKFKPLEEAGFIDFELGISAEQRIIEGQIKQEQNEKLQQVIKTLSSRQREAIYYLYHEGMAYGEIKELMGFSNIRSVRNLVYRALASIKSAIVQLCLIGSALLFQLLQHTS